MPTTPEATASSSAYAVYRGEAVDDATLSSIALLMHRVTRRSVANSKGLVTSSHELVVLRDQWGEVRSVQGFRFEKLTDAGQPIRLIYALFSVVDPDARAARNAPSVVGTSVLEREREAHPAATITWASAPGCDADFGLSRQRVVRRLVLGPQSAVPHNLQLYTTAPAAASVSNVVSDAVEQAVRTIVTEQRQRDFNGRMPGGHTSVSLGAAPASTAPRGLAPVREKLLLNL